MAETLLSPSIVHLYGRVLEDLKFSPHIEAGLGANSFLRRQLDVDDEDNPQQFARVYGFSFEGHYYDMTRPTIFLVHGDGLPAQYPVSAQDANGRSFAQAARAPGRVDNTGTGSQAGSMADDIRVWTYDKADFLLRFDVESGPLAQILLEAELEDDVAAAHYSGAKVGGGRVGGGRVSGAKVSGAKVGGGRVGGGRVGGGRVGGRED